MISVAMATYNGEKHILQQLQSIKDQTRSVNEVVICDDGSKDRTVEIIERYIKKNKLQIWTVIKNQENLGYSKNFFKSVSLCNGDFIFLSDQDDVWAEDKVEKMVSFMEKDQSVFALSTNYTVVDKEGALHHKVQRQKSNRELAVQELVGSSSIKGCTMCIRKKLDTLIPHEDISLGLQLGHDWYYNFLASLIGKNVALADYLFFYREHGENISLQRNNRKTVLSVSPKRRIMIFDEMISSCQAVIDRLESYGIEVSEDKLKDTEKMLRFCKTRRSFVGGKKTVGIKLLFSLGKYRKISISWKSAWHALASDFLYAYNINGRLLGK